MKIFQPTQINEIADKVKQGKVVALPTETVYGLAVLPDNALAIERLNSLKRRDRSKKYALMLAGISQIPRYALVDDLAQEIINKYLPGELTLILPKNPNYDNEHRRNDGEIGIRVPNDGFLQKILQLTGPMLVTSANLSGEPPLSTSDDVIEKLPGVEVVVEGKAGARPPTTIIELRNGEIITHRQGSLVVG